MFKIIKKLQEKSNMKFSLSRGEKIQKALLNGTALKSIKARSSNNFKMIIASEVLLENMAGLTRLELATFRVTGGRSDQTELQPRTMKK